MSAISKEAIAGVWPADFGEASIMEVWPSMAAFGPARALGGLYNLTFPIGFFIAVATLPIALAFWAMTLFWRYTLTTHAIRTRSGPKGKVRAEVMLSDLEAVRIAANSMSRFYNAGDLELVVRGGAIAAVLKGVPSPETFRQNILRARDALVQVSAIRTAQKKPEPAAVAVS